MEAKQRYVESWVHPHLKQAPVDLALGSGLDILTQSATHQLGSLSIRLISLNLDFLVWKMESKLPVPHPSQGCYED